MMVNSCQRLGRLVLFMALSFSAILQAAGSYVTHNSSSSGLVDSPRNTHEGSAIFGPMVYWKEADQVEGRALTPNAKQQDEDNAALTHPALAPSSSRVLGDCPGNCTSCTSSTACTSCAVKFHKNGGGTCSACMDNCATCSTGSTCDTCPSNRYLSATTSRCVACNTTVGCATCESSQTKCTSCTADLYLTSANTCVTAENFNSCPTNCISCTSSTACTSCALKYYINGAGTCSPCQDNCGTCSTGFNCTTCPSNRYLSAATSICVACNTTVGCATCATSQTKCTSCIGELVLTSTSTCVTVASPGNPQGGGDPWMVGFQGQRFFFDGEDAKWYNVVEDPIKKLIINMRMSERRGVGTFTDGVGIAVMGSTGIAHTIAFTVVVAKDNFSPKCTTEAGICLGGGAIAFEIDGEVLTEPMHFALADEDIEVFAVNAPFACKRIPDAHMHWEEQVAHMQMAKAREGDESARHALQRRLGENSDEESYRTVLSYFINGERSMFNENNCADWVGERLVEGDVYEVPGSMSTIFINTPAFSLRLEYTMNVDETTWSKHHRFDWFLGSYHPFKDGAGGVAVGGVLGETGVVKHDRTGQAILGDRFSILSSPKDSDYEVDGAFGRQFKAMP